MSNPFDAPAHSESFGSPKSFKIKRIGVLSVAIFSGAAGACVGLLAGLIIALAAGAGAAQGPNGIGTLAGLGVGALVFAPLFYGIFGFIGGAFNAFIYNLIAGMTGGIELHFGD